MELLKCLLIFHLLLFHLHWDRFPCLPHAITGTSFLTNAGHVLLWNYLDEQEQELFMLYWALYFICVELSNFSLTEKPYCTFFTLNEILLLIKRNMYFFIEFINHKKIGRLCENLLLIIAFYGSTIAIPIIISILLRKLPSLSIAMSIFTFLLGMYLYIPETRGRQTVWKQQIMPESCLQ